MRSHIVFFVIIACYALISGQKIYADTSDHATCERLEELWHMLYGAQHPLEQYIHQYRAAITHAASLESSVLKRTAEQDPATLLVLTELQSQLVAIKQQADALLQQYTIAPAVPVNTLDPLTLVTAPPPLAATTQASPQETDALLKQLLTSLGSLQQNPYNPAYADSSLKEQVWLFVGGILALATCTSYIYYRISGNSRILHKKIDALLDEYHTPHYQKDGMPCAGTTGICEEVKHIHAELNKRMAP